MWESSPHASSVPSVTTARWAERRRSAAAAIIAVAASGALGLAPAAALAVPAGSQEVAGGAVKATLSWQGSKEQYDGVVAPRLKLERAGVVALTRASATSATAASSTAT